MTIQAKQQQNYSAFCRGQGDSCPCAIFYRGISGVELQKWQIKLRGGGGGVWEPSMKSLKDSNVF